MWDNFMEITFNLETATQRIDRGGCLKCYQIILLTRYLETLQIVEDLK